MKRVSMKTADRLVKGFCLVMVCISMYAGLTAGDPLGVKIAGLSLCMWGGMFLLFTWLFKERGA